MAGQKEPMNKKVVILSLIALLFLYLTYAVDWIFIIGAALIAWINHKEIIGT